MIYEDLIKRVRVFASEGIKHNGNEIIPISAEAIDALRVMMLEVADAIEGLTEDNVALNNTITNLLEQIKTIRPKGKWIKHDTRINGYDSIYYECSACGRILPHNLFQMRYCPNCGAEMIGDKENNR